MARISRIPKTLHEKLLDFDHHQYLLREALHRLSDDAAHLKMISAELRTLVCLSSGTDGLLWRLITELNVSDKILLEAAVSLRKDAPVNTGVRFATIPLNRPGNAPPGITPKWHSLRDVIKNYEAVHLSSFQGPKITHEYLIKAISQQMGSAHEDDGLEPSIRRLQRIFLNGVQPYTRVLAIDAELTLQVGERLLDRAEQQLDYHRAQRQHETGDVTVVLRCRRVSNLVVSVPVVTFRSEISDVEIRCISRTASFAVQFIKKGELIREESIPFVVDMDLSLFAVSYSSDLRQVRLIMNGNGLPPVNCDLGWLDAREIAQPVFHLGTNDVVQHDWAFAFSRLLSTTDCTELRMVHTEDVIGSMQEAAKTGGFPE
jgi:hypothetical protein